MFFIQNEAGKFFTGIRAARNPDLSAASKLVYTPVFADTPDGGHFHWSRWEIAEAERVRLSTLEPQFTTCRIAEK